MPWTVELWRDHRGEAPVGEYIERAHRSGEHSATATMNRYVELLKENGPNLGMPQDRLLDGKVGLYELRAGNHRIAYGEAGGALWLLEAWRKTARLAPRNRVDRARRRLLGLRGERHGERN